MSFFLRKTRLIDLFKNNKIHVISSMPEFAFEPENQIEGDAINLRLHPIVKKMRQDIAGIDLLDDDTEKYFESFQLSTNGYILRPDEILFCTTLEKIRLTSRQHLGLVFGRPTIATYGISVTLDQSKVPIDLSWNFPLHLRNNTKHEIKIYPFVNIAQLLLFEYKFGNIAPYSKEGKFYNTQYDNRFPGIIGNERQNLKAILNSWKSISVQPSDFKNNDIIQEKRIKIGNKRFKFPIVSFIDVLFTIVLGLSPIIFNQVINHSHWYTYPGYGLLLVLLVIIKSIL